MSQCREIHKRLDTDCRSYEAAAKKGLLPDFKKPRKGDGKKKETEAEDDEKETEKDTKERDDNSISIWSVLLIRSVTFYENLLAKNMDFSWPKMWYIPIIGQKQGLCIPSVLYEMYFPFFSGLEHTMLLSCLNTCTRRS